MNTHRIRCLALAALPLLGGCGWIERSERLEVYRTPAEMISGNDRFYAGSPNAVSSVNPASSRPTVSNNALAQPNVEPPANGRGLLTRPVPTSQPATALMTPMEAVRQANTHALEQATPGAFVNAVQIYDFEPGRVYEVLTTPGFVTSIHLRPGEALKHAAAGDTTRWIVDSFNVGTKDALGHEQLSLTTAAADAAPTSPARALVLVKPRHPGLHTNLLIATDERTYLLELRSVEHTAYHSAVEWRYANDQIPIAAPAPSAAPRAESIETGARNYAYVIKADDENPPDWTPWEVYDDGRRVYVEFPTDAQRLPALYVLGDDDEVRLVNSTSYPDRLVIHERFERAELHADGKRVRIESVRHHQRSRPFAGIRRFLAGRED